MCLILPGEGRSVDYPEGNEWPMPHLAGCGMHGDRDLGLKGARRGKKARTTVRNDGHERADDPLRSERGGWAAGRLHLRCHPVRDRPRRRAMALGVVGALVQAQEQILAWLAPPS